jgi:hypothetical protein
VRKRLKRITRRTLPWLPACLALPGCYTFTSVEPAALEPGMSVRVTIDRAEAVKQAEVLGGTGTVVQGTVSDQSTPDSIGIFFRPTGLTRFNSFVEVPWSSVQQVEAKSFSPSRTAGLVAIGAVVAVAVIAVADELGTADGEDPPPNNLVSIPLSWFFR